MIKQTKKPRLSYIASVTIRRTAIPDLQRQLAASEAGLPNVDAKERKYARVHIKDLEYALKELFNLTVLLVEDPDADK